jgi:hypothetical protein
MPLDDGTFRPHKHSTGHGIVDSNRHGIYTGPVNNHFSEVRSTLLMVPVSHSDTVFLKTVHISNDTTNNNGTITYEDNQAGTSRSLKVTQTFIVLY